MSDESLASLLIRLVVAFCLTAAIATARAQEAESPQASGSKPVRSSDSVSAKKPATASGTQRSRPPSPSKVPLGTVQGFDLAIASEAGFGVDFQR